MTIAVDGVSTEFSIGGNALTSGGRRRAEAGGVPSPTV